MAFFSEIKARLGLDITDFEKGMSQAQGSLGKVVDGATGKLGNLKMLGTTLATALGLNLQTIAEGVARMVVGFSKDQEDALLKLAARSAAVADEMEKRAKQRRGDDDPVVRVQNLQTDIATQVRIIEQNAPLTKKQEQDIMFSDRNISNLPKGHLEIKEENERRIKARADADEEKSKLLEQIRLANDEIRKKTETLNKDTAKTEEESRLKILSIDEKIAEARAKIAEPAPAKTANADTDTLKIAEQANNKAKARADLIDLQTQKQDQLTAVTQQTTDIEEKARLKILSTEERIAELRAKHSKPALDVAKIEAPKIEVPKIKAPELPISGDKGKSELEIKQQSLETAKDGAELLDLETKKQEEIGALTKATDKVREDALNETLTLEQQILLAKAKVYDLELNVNKSQEGSVDQAKAGLALEQEKANLTRLEREQSKKQSDELDTQLKTLQNHKKTIEQTLAAQAKAPLLPSMADVVSGKRNIGGVARGRATQLKRDRASALDLADAEQRAREELASGIKTGGIDKVGGIASIGGIDSIGGIPSIMGEDPLGKGRRIRSELDQTRSRITTNENLLGSRISDANPNAAMEKELLEINAQLKILNYTTLAPQKIK